MEIKVVIKFGQMTMSDGISEKGRGIINRKDMVRERMN
jgi:hypothetical protein